MGRSRNTRASNTGGDAGEGGDSGAAGAAASSDARRGAAASSGGGDGGDTATLDAAADAAARDAAREAVADVDAEAFFEDDETFVEDVQSTYQSAAAAEVDRYADAEVARRVAEHIDSVRVMPDDSGLRAATGRDRDAARLELGKLARESTAHHELGHALVDAYGYATDATMDASMRYDASEDNFVAAPLGDTADGGRGGGGLSREDYVLSQRGDGAAPPAEVEQLVSAVNAAWERIQRAGQDDYDTEFDLDDAAIQRNYSAVNANETFALFHQMMQSSRLPSDTDAAWFDVHDDLVRAYCDVIEPSPRMQELVSYLHHTRDESPFDEDPFPDADTPADE